MAENVAQEIRAKEAMAKEIVADAKREAARITATARTAAEQSVKEAKQRFHRSFREQVKETEVSAMQNATVAVEAGAGEAEALYKRRKPDTAGVAEWLVGEVIATYGLD